MYDRLGYTSLIRIASPAAVVHATVDGPPSPNAAIDFKSDDNYRNINMCSSEMKHIAIEADDMKSQTEAENKINNGLKKLFLFAEKEEETKNN